MPTKRRFILFLIVLALMLLIKRAVGQEVGPALGWQYSGWDYDVEAYAYGAVMHGLFWGMVLGAGRVLARNIALHEGRYFTGDLVTLQLS